MHCEVAYSSDVSEVPTVDKSSANPIASSSFKAHFLMLQERYTTHVTEDWLAKGRG